MPSPLKVDEDGNCPDWRPHFRKLTLTDARLVFYSHTKEGLANFFREKSDLKVWGGDAFVIYAYRGRYSKTRKFGKTEMYDSMDLGHNGWKAGVLSHAGVDLPLPEGVQDLIEEALPHILSTSRYYVGFQLFKSGSVGKDKGNYSYDPNRAHLLHGQKTLEILTHGKKEIPFKDVAQKLGEKGWTGIVDLP